MSARLIDREHPFLEGVTHAPAGCETCKEVHLVEVPGPCPSCGKRELERQPAKIAPRPPEKVVPFAVDEDAVRRALRLYTRRTWFRVPELHEALLMERLQRVWLPMWLVDATVHGSWQAEAGFDYEVQSTLESYANGAWRTRLVTDTRTRWEPRRGTLVRRFDNVAVAALIGQERIEAHIGSYARDGARDFELGDLRGAALRLPDLRPESAWPAAEAAITHLTASVCRAACGAEHIRNTYLKAEHSELNWTWLLLPVYTTWYTDNQGRRWALYLNGQTGRVAGPRFASGHKAAFWGSLIAVLATSIGAVGLVVALLGILAGPLLLVALILLGAAFFVFLLACWPAVFVWGHNRKQPGLQLFPVPEAGTEPG